MISMLFSLLVMLLICGVVWYVISMLPLPEPFGTIAKVIVLLVFVLVLLDFLFGATAAPFFHPAMVR